MIAVLAIARATILELRRQRLMIVPLIGIALSLLALGGVLLLADGDLQLQERDAELAALATGIGAAMAATVYAAIVGAGLISREISAGTMLMLAARPIGRWQIIAGRVLGAGVFLVGLLVLVCTAYAITASVTSGSFAPFDEPYVALGYGIPAVLLGLSFAVAASVQGKAIAATGSAIAIMLFAWGVGIYASEVREERHFRSFLTEQVRDRVDSNDGIVGPAALALTRVLPFWVFMEGAIAQVDEREQYQYEYQGVTGPDDRIDTTRSDGMTGFGTAVPIDPAGAGPDEWEPPKLPDEPTDEAFACAEYGGARCFLGYRDAWTVRSFEQPGGIHERGGVLFAWLAIPVWIGVAMLLLHRRRDLS